MPLPTKIEYPTYRRTLCTGIDVKFRPYTMNEEKILLSGREDGKNAIDSVITVAENCCVESPVKPGDMCAADFEALFILIRAKSVEESVKVKVKVDGVVRTLEVHLEQLEMKPADPDVERDVELGPGMFVRLRYPTIRQLFSSGADSYAAVASCIESVVDGDEVSTRSDFTEAEAREFVLKFDTRAMAKVKKFLDKGPRVTIPVKYKGDDGTEQVHVFRGLGDFLA